jgi:hypothetical protein
MKGVKPEDISEWSVYFTRQFQQWLPKMPGDILTFWIEGRAEKKRVSWSVVDHGNIP